MIVITLGELVISSRSKRENFKPSNSLPLSTPQQSIRKFSVHLQTQSKEADGKLTHSHFQSCYTLVEVSSFSSTSVGIVGPGLWLRVGVRALVGVEGDTQEPEELFRLRRLVTSGGVNTLPLLRYQADIRQIK